MPARSGRMTLDGLNQPATIQWSDDGTITVEAANETDLFAALGYVHGADKAWTMTLWRQAALGHLSKWFGSDYVGHDRHARMLGFGSLARASYEALPIEEKAVLDAYARGANLALSSWSVRQRDEFVLLDLEPAPWLPWHALAVERMMAWFGTPTLEADSSFSSFARADSALVRFARSDSLFRGMLHLGGANESRAWTARLGETTIAAQQLAYGNSALPLFREVVLRVGNTHVLVATVPGTIMLPAGQSDNRMWSVFLTSDVALAPTDSLPPPPLFDRLVDRDGNETLLTFPRSVAGLYFKAEPAAASPTAILAAVDSLGEAAVVASVQLADSLRRMLREREGTASVKRPPAWLVTWRGFAAGSDIRSWRALLNEAETPSFTLFLGDGLISSSNGSTAILGSPPVREELPNGTFVAVDPLARFAASRLRTLLSSVDSSATRSDTIDPAILMMDSYSPWAATITPRLIEQLGNRDSLDASIKDAYAFLHGWDYKFDRGSLGASLFERWMTEYRKKVGQLPGSSPDSGRTVILQETLRDAVDRITAEHGDQTSAWRWELVQPGVRYFPIWNDPSRRTPPSRFAPLTSSLGGHPTSLLYGPSMVFDGPPAPSVWTAWSLTSNWSRTHIYHPITQTTGFLARELALEEPPRSYVVRRDVTFSSPLHLRPSD